MSEQNNVCVCGADLSECDKLIDVYTPFLQVIGGRKYRLLFENVARQILLSDGSNVETRLKTLERALSAFSTTRFAENIYMRDTFNSQSVEGDRCYVFDASDDENVEKGGAMYIWHDGEWQLLYDGDIPLDVNSIISEGGGLKIVDGRLVVDLAALIDADGYLKIADDKLGLDLAALVDADSYGLSIRDGKLASSPYLLGEFYFFRHPTLRAGFEVLDGGEIENGAEMYPEIWAYLQTAEGQLLCKTAAEREALANHVYYTLENGTEITYGGIGGVPFYTIDTATGEIVMPDIRGMHLEAAGFDSLNVGNVAIDAIRRIQGTLGAISTDSLPAWSTGALYYKYPNHTHRTQNSLANEDGYDCQPSIDSGRVAPYGAVNRPRSLGVLACAYMGRPAS